MTMERMDKYSIVEKYLASLESYTGQALQLCPETISAIAQAMEVRRYSRWFFTTRIGEQEEYLHLVVQGWRANIFYGGGMK